MTHPFNRLLIAGCLCLNLNLLVGCQPTANADARDKRAANRGIDTAEQDIASGRLCLCELPTQSPAWWGDYHLILIGKCGVHCKMVDRIDDQAEAYNKVMLVEIERVHGVGVLKRLQDEARASYAARVRKKM